MKRKNMILIGGLILLVFFLYLIPLLIEFQKVHIRLFGSCIGTGCRSFSGSSTSSIGGVYCDGYELGFFCLSDKWKYCFYISPLSIDRCLCEAKGVYERGYYSEYRKFCPKNNFCYSNSFEYEFGCTENLERTCREIEKEISDATVEANYRCDSAHAYGIISSISQCSEKYIYIYEKAENEQRKKIFNEGFIDRKKGQGAGISNICTFLCTSCNSSLCEQNNICEYVEYPVNDTK